MAVAVVLRGGNSDRVLQPPFLEVLRHLRRVELRLLARLRERVDALDGDAKRDHRHDHQNDADGFRHGSHLSPHFDYVHSPILRNLKNFRISTDYATATAT